MTDTESCRSEEIIERAVRALRQTPTPDGRAEAAEVMAQGAAATCHLRSVHIRCRMRTLPRDHFDLIGSRYEFVNVELWKQFGERPKWRIEKPGRVAVMNGESAVMLIKKTPARPVGIRSATGDGWSEWLRELLDVDRILERELTASFAHGWDFNLVHEEGEGGSRKRVVTIEARSGLEPNSYLKNTFFGTEDSRRVYRFDAETRHLEAVTVYLYADEGETMIFETTWIGYDAIPDPSVFDLPIPPDTMWHEPPPLLPDNPKYERMTPEEVARAFFEACSKEDWDEAWKFTPWPVPDTSLGGLTILHLGEAFEAAPYPGRFVPYEIRLSDGQVQKHNLALKRHPGVKRFLVDGGI